MESADYIKCIICGSEVRDKLYDSIEREGRVYSVYACKRCDMAVTHPFPDSRAIDALYSSGSYREHGKRFVGPMENLVRRFRASRLKRVEKYSKKGHMLDIGCGRGLILSMARERGWKATGIELNDDTAYHAREVLGLDIRTGDLRDAGFDDASFDAVTMWHSFEHLKDPAGTLAECRRILKPGGLLVVSVPNFGSLQSKLTGRHWFHLDVPFHLYHFSTSALLKLLSQHSFRTFRVDHFSLEFNPFGFLQSMYNISGIRHNLLYDTLKSKGIKRGGTLGGYLGMALLAPIIFPVSQILTAVEAIARRGGSIEVFARRAA